MALTVGLILAAILGHFQRRGGYGARSRYEQAVLDLKINGVAFLRPPRLGLLGPLQLDAGGFTIHRLRRPSQRYEWVALIRPLVIVDVHKGNLAVAFYTRDGNPHCGTWRPFAKRREKFIERRHLLPSRYAIGLDKIILLMNGLREQALVVAQNSSPPPYENNDCPRSENRSVADAASENLLELRKSNPGWLVEMSLGGLVAGLLVFLLASYLTVEPEPLKVEKLNEQTNAEAAESNVPERSIGNSSVYEAQKHEPLKVDEFNEQPDVEATESHVLARAMGNSNVDEAPRHVSAGSRVNQEQHFVRAYKRANGAYVGPYIATNPDHVKGDNFTSKGNINPYTGTRGHR